MVEEFPLSFLVRFALETRRRRAPVSSAPA